MLTYLKLGRTWNSRSYYIIKMCFLFKNFSKHWFLYYINFIFRSNSKIKDANSVSAFSFQPKIILPAKRKKEKNIEIRYCFIWFFVTFWVEKELKLRKIQLSSFLLQKMIFKLKKVYISLIFLWRELTKV